MFHSSSSFQEYTSSTEVDENGNIINKKSGRAKIKNGDREKHYVLDRNGRYIEVSPEEYEEFSNYRRSLPSLQSYIDELSPVRRNFRAPRPLLKTETNTANNRYLRNLERENRYLRSLLDKYTR